MFQNLYLNIKNFLALKNFWKKKLNIKKIFWFKQNTQLSGKFDKILTIEKFICLNKKSPYFKTKLVRKNS